MKNPYRKWRDPHVLFLDDGFDCDEAFDRLRKEGIAIQRFHKHFKRTHDGGREQRVEDPRVIRLCNRHGWLLITTDSNMEATHRGEIAQSESLAILATAHNTVENIMEWVDGLVKLLPTIEKNNFRKRERPWFAAFSRHGIFTVGPRKVLMP